MDVGKRRAGASQAFGGLSALFKAAFAARPAILPNAFVSYNLGIGLLLCLGAVLVLANPQVGSVPSALALAALGVALSAGFFISRLRPAALARTLAVHGVLLALLALSFALSALHWALWAAIPGSFHYLPGVALVLSVYGALQIAEFGYWRASSRGIRIAGVWFGIILELGMLGGFAVHLMHNR